MVDKYTFGWKESQMASKASLSCPCCKDKERKPYAFTLEATEKAYSCVPLAGGGFKKCLGGKSHTVIKVGDIFRWNCEQYLKAGSPEPTIPKVTTQATQAPKPWWEEPWKD